MLARALERERLHHGLLLAGPRGVGKATLARGLACAILCEVEPATGCGKCNSCLRVLNGHHTDITVLEGEGKSRTVTADSARAAALRSQHAPFERTSSRPGHLVIIDPADRMQPKAAAALLKSLEEPPPGVYFALLATNANDLLDTLRSRCLSIRLEGIEDGLVERVLAEESARRGLTLEPKRQALAIQLSEGSPGLALELAMDPSLDLTTDLLGHTLASVNHGAPGIFAGDGSPLWSAWKQAVLAAPDPSEEGGTPSNEDDQLIVVKGKKKRPMKKSAKKSAKKSKKPTETAAKQRAAANRLAELWLIHLRELSRGRGGLSNMPRLRLGESAELSRQMSMVQQFQAGLARNPNVRLALENTLLRLTDPHERR
jgi:DNA polymerase-3 subunit delta'